MGYGRTRKQAKLDEEKTFDDIIKQGPRESAKKAFKHKPYQPYGQEKTMPYYNSVAEFYEERLKWGGGAGRQGAN